MAIRIKGIDKLTKNLQKKLNKSIRSEKLLKDIGQSTVEYLQFEIRKGNDPGTGKKRIITQDDDNIKRRKEIAKYNTKHPTYSPRRGNLTITGQLVESLMYKIKNKTLTIQATGKHKGYKNANGKTGKSTRNAKIATGVESYGWTMYAITDKFKKKVTKKVVEFIRRNL